MKLITITLFLASMNLLFSQTTIPAGNVSGNWDLAGSPYLIEGEIEIPNGETLIIDPGCLIEFQGHYKFNVQGRLLAVGTEQDTIRFSITDTTGFSNHIIPDGGWHGIRFDNTPVTNDSSKIVYCSLEYGKAIGDNWVERSGGVIYIDDFSKVQISNSTMMNNYAADFGGAIHDNGGIIIANSTITNNKSGEWGGAIYTQGYSSGQYTNLTVSYNSALSGGGLYLSNNPLIRRCKIINNRSSGVQIEDSSPKIINCLICNNSINGIYVFEMGWDESIPKIINCTIANNGAYGIRYYYDDWWWPHIDGASNNKNNKIIGTSSCDRSITGKNNIFSGNLSGSVSSDGSTSLNYCAFSDDLPSFAGIGCISTELHFEDPTLGAGVSYNALEADWSLQSNSMCIDRGTPDTTGLYLPDFDLAGDPRVFQGIIPRIDIGAYEFQGEPDQIPDIYVNPRNFDFYLCSIDSFSLEKSFTISNIGYTDLEIFSIVAPECFLIKKENDTEFGSAIEPFAIEANSMETINIVFNPNTAIIYSDNITITSNDPDENISSVGVTGAGDIYPVVYGNISEDTTWDSEIVKVTGNIIVENGRTLTINPGTNVRIMGSFSFNIQGRILAEGTEQDSIFFTSKDSNSWWNGIKYYNTPVTNDSSKFSYCKFSRSYHSPGGVFYIYNFSKIKFNFCTFINNKAVNYGGAIYTKYSDISILNSQFIANEALASWDYVWSSPGCGAGLYIVHSSVELINCIIKNNHAHAADDYPYGGGIYSYNSDLKLINSKIIENYSNIAQAIFLRRSNLDMYNSIISQHESYNGNVIFANDSTNISLINTTIFHNTGNNVEFGTWGISNTFYTDYSCIEGGENSIIHVYNGTVDWNENNIEEDPLFTDPVNGDFHLQSDSPCINSGTPSGWVDPFLYLPINEILGYEPVDDNYDIGCYEYQEYLVDLDDIDFGEILYNVTTPGVQVMISNSSEEDFIISSIEASTHFLVKQNVEDQYTNRIENIDLLADSEVSFWIACRPMDDGLIDGEISIYTNAIPSRAVISVSANVNVVEVLKLYNNFPNPFNPETTIKFSIPQESKVVLTVYNIKGQQVKTIVNNTCEMGINMVIWNGTNDAGSKVGTGVYFYKLDVDSKTIKTKKMLLLK